jgi:hypothetical protein
MNIVYRVAFILLIFAAIIVSTVFVSVLRTPQQPYPQPHRIHVHQCPIEEEACWVPRIVQRRN